jgi:glycosyltransferase involved in cell wall biosynthesis
LTEAGIHVDAVRLTRAASPIAFAKTVATIRRHRPSIVHTHLVHADFHGLPAAKLARVPVLASTKHGFNPFRSSRAFAVADRTIGRLARIHIAISNGLADYLARTEGFAASEFDVVHYGVDPGPEPELYAGDVPRLAVIGRLVPIKGHAVLLEAVAAVRRTLPSLEVEIAGAGPLDAELRARAQELGLEKSVRFLGQIPSVTELMERAAVVVVPSLGEGFGMVALEAMERGRAVVASATGGLSEIVADGETGVLVPAGDVDALAEGILSLAADLPRALEMGSRGRRRAVAKFPQERCTARIEVLYRAALDAVGVE